MREIKFELIEDGKIIGYETYHPNYNGGVWYHVLYVEGEDAVCHCKTYWSEGFNKLERRQYIGRHDKDGKEIYEGDKAQTFGLMDNISGVVEWNESKLTWVLHPFDWHEGQGFNLAEIQGRIEVIGNIYENPELMI